MASSLRVHVGSANDLIQVSVEVHQELNQHGWCFAEFRAPNDARPTAETWLGLNLQVDAVDEDGSVTIFTGFVWQSELHYDGAGGYNVLVTAVTPSWRLEVTHDQNAFRNKSLSAVASDLCARDGVAVSVSVKDQTPWPYLVQWGLPDMPFLVKRAYERRAWIRATVAGIEIRDEFANGPTTINWLDKLLHVAVVGRVGPRAVRGTYYDPTTTLSKTVNDFTSNPSFLGSHRIGPAVLSASRKCVPPSAVYRTSHAVSDAEFQSRLGVESERNLSQVYAIGVSREPRVGIGNSVGLQRLPDGVDDGPCGVIKVIHTWTQAMGYKNEFVASLTSQWMSVAPPERHPPTRRWHILDRPGLFPTVREDGGSYSSGFSTVDSNCERIIDSLGHSHYHLSQPYLGVVIARVTDNNDPKHLGRLKVQYIWADEPTDWIRLATGNAGFNRGILFLPEVGDEVLIAFEDGDPNFPIVIGSLWNSANNNEGVREPFVSPAGIANNDVKRICTKGGLRITLCDTPGEQGLTIVTPFASIKLLEKNSQTGLPMIALETENGDIFLGAPNGRVHINSKFYSKEIG
jgi:uncharacterized protein involved in type VI secretion and phage assembly